MHKLSTVMHGSCILNGSAAVCRGPPPATGGAGASPLMKSRRQSVSLELIDTEPLHNQEQLRRRLLKAGFEATQATISRDIKELGLLKRARDGAYQRAVAEAENPATMLGALEHAASEFLRRIERVQQLVIVRTGAGQAQ